MENLRDVIENLTDYEVIDIWNEYCDSNRYYEDRIEDWDLLNNIFCGMSPTEILERYADDYSKSNGGKYFQDGIYGLNFFDNPFDVIDLDDLTDFVESNIERFDYISDIADYIEEISENSEENT